MCPLAFESFLLLSIPWIFIGVVLFDHRLGAVRTSRLCVVLMGIFCSLCVGILIIVALVFIHIIMK
jgi:hypothetical protein